MKLETVNISLTEEELIVIHTALEDSVKASIEKGLKYPKYDTVADLKPEIELLRVLSQHFGYECSIWPSDGNFKKHKSFKDVDEWVKALVKEAKARQEKK